MKRKAEDNRVRGETVYLRTANHYCVSTSNFNQEMRPGDQLLFHHFSCHNEVHSFLVRVSNRVHNFSCNNEVQNFAVSNEVHNSS